MGASVVKILAILSLNFLQMMSQRLPKTSDLSALVTIKQATLSRNQDSIVLSKTLWHKVEILLTIMEQVACQSTVPNLLTRTLTLSTTSVDYFQWPTLVPVPTAVNSLLLLERLNGLMVPTLSLESSLKVTMCSSKSRLPDHALARLPKIWSLRTVVNFTLISDKGV